MRGLNKLFALCAGWFLAVIAPASAQAPAVDDLVRKTVTDAANALGMVRGLNRSLEIVNMFEYTAHGAIVDSTSTRPSKVSRITAAYDYVIPAARVDITTVGADGQSQRTIEVAAGQLAWDESKPGIYLRPAGTAAAERLKLIWLLPQGVILAAAKALDKIKVGERNGLRELVVPLPTGAEARALLDAAHLMTDVEIKIGGQVFAGTYAGYKDFQGYGVIFPERIVQKVDGRVLAELTVTESLANPYMIFPPPKELGQKP
jgi:hypothetical protein